jgi:hypothetical protein
MGGINSRLPVERWHRTDGVKWLVPQDWGVQHPDAIALETLQMSFGDLLASCDALLCKPGYGSFVEAACSGIPVLYINRPDWPESPALVGWLPQYVACREVSQDILEGHEIEKFLLALWNSTKSGRVVSPATTPVTSWLTSRLSFPHHPEPKH